MNAYIQKIDGSSSRKAPEIYKKLPLPISQKTEIILVDSKAERFTIVTVEPGVRSVGPRPAQKVDTSIRYDFTYTVNRYVGERTEVLTERAGTWEFKLGQGLSVETDRNHADEVNRVMEEALRGVYGLAGLIMARSDPSVRKVTLLPLNWTKGQQV